MSAANAGAARDAVTLHDQEPAPDVLAEEVVDGLSAAPKSVPCKFLYDERGAELFERICALEAYYPTRTETGILRENAAEMAALLGPRCRVVEFGSGSGAKTRILLEALRDPVAYLPVDIARAQLVEFAAALSGEFPALEVLPVCADYTREVSLPRGAREPARTVVFFPGSTIGNFSREAAAAFLRRTRALCGDDGALLIGVDLKKDPAVLERAYDDPEGVTAAFDLNLLERINRECDADFDLSAFRHEAEYRPAEGRVEMRLVSERAQTVRLFRGRPGQRAFHFAAGEPIVTEHCHKYDVEEFGALAARAGFRTGRVWTDAAGLFSVHYLEAA